MLRLRLLIAVVASAAPVLSGCSGGSDPVVAPVVTAIERGVDGARGASRLACEADRNQVQMALDAFAMLERRPPRDQSELVPDWLREPSAWWDIRGGVVVPTPNSPCA